MSCTCSGRLTMAVPNKKGLPLDGSPMNLSQNRREEFYRDQGREIFALQTSLRMARAEGPGLSESADRHGCRARRARPLVAALGEQRHQHHQIRQSKQPLVGLKARSFRGASDKAEMAALGEIVDVIDADARQSGDF